jgi:hypothetical protein
VFLRARTWITVVPDGTHPRTGTPAISFNMPIFGILRSIREQQNN